MNGMTKIGLGLLLGALCTVAAAQGTSRVGSVTQSRFGTSWTLDGSNMVNARAKLQNAANFGAGGTFAKSIQITDTAGSVGSVTAGLLANFDVFFIGYLNDGNPNAFTGAELAAMQAWVNAGGTMIVTCDDANYDAVCSLFGHPSDPNGPGVNPIVPTAAGTAHPLFSGPFGNVASIQENGTQGTFTSTTGATVLAVDSTAGTPLPVVLIRSVGAGRVVLLADVDLIADSLSGGATITNPNDQFLGNLFAFTGGFVGPAAVATAPIPTLSMPMLATLALFVAALAYFGRRRRA